MYLEFDEISFVGMSNSDLFLAENDPKLLEFEFLLRPTLEFSDECQSTPASEERRHNEDNQQRLHRQDEDKGGEIEENKKCEQIQVMSLKKLEMPSVLLGNDQELLNKDGNVYEDNDGFRTPTSLDKKIPVIPPQCPPPPRKPKSRPSTKRKSSSNHHRHFQVIHDFSEDIESLFPPALLADLGRKIKKARR